MKALFSNLNEPILKKDENLTKHLLFYEFKDILSFLFREEGERQKKKPLSKMRFKKT
jgi:hypothetical protein